MTGSETTETNEAREQIINAFARTAVVYGLNQSYGRLYGVLFFANGPLSLDELVDESDYAKSTVSTAMRALERLYLVRRAAVPGTGKQVFYEAERDFWYVLQELLRREGTRELMIMTQALDSAEETLADAATEGAERDRQRLRDLRQTYEQLSTISEGLASHSAEELIDQLDTLAPEAARERKDS